MFPRPTSRIVDIQGIPEIRFPKSPSLLIYHEEEWEVSGVPQPIPPRQWFLSWRRALFVDCGTVSDSFSSIIVLKHKCKFVSLYKHLTGVHISNIDYSDNHQALIRIFLTELGWNHTRQEEVTEGRQRSGDHFPTATSIQELILTFPICILTYSFGPSLTMFLLFNLLRYFSPVYSFVTRGWGWHA